MQRKLNVVVPATTFPASLNAVLLSDNMPRLCDVGDDFLIDVNEEQIISKGIDVIMPVHLFGYACEMDKLLEIKKKHGIFILEDCCEATGSSYKGKKVGSIGDAGVFSFYLGHNLGVGELGCITTNNDKLAELIRSIKNHGRVGSNLQFNHNYVGTNGKTTEFMTALAYAQIDQIDNIMNKRKAVVKYFNNNIVNPSLILPKYSDNCSYLGYPIGCKDKTDRDLITIYLNSHGIETRHIFPCLVRQPAYNMKLNKEDIELNLPCSNYIHDTYFYIPCHQYLTKLQINMIVQVINNDPYNNIHR